MADIDNLTDAVQALKIAIQEVGLCDGRRADRVKVLARMLEDFEIELDHAKDEEKHSASVKHQQAAKLLATAKKLLAAEGPAERMYHVVGINDKTKVKVYMTRTPVTHQEGVTIMKKIHTPTTGPHKDRRVMLEPVTEATKVESPTGLIPIAKSAAEAPKSSQAYTQNQEIRLPDVEIHEDKPEYVYVPLRGYGHVMAVFDKEDNCVGWILSETLGSPSVKDWIKTNKWIDQGY